MAAPNRLCQLQQHLAPAAVSLAASPAAAATTGPRDHSKFAVDLAVGPKFAFFEGKIVPIDEAKVSVMTTTLHYGTGCFGGLRAYWNEEKQELFAFRQCASNPNAPT